MEHHVTEPRPSASVLPPIQTWTSVAAPIGAVHIVHGLAEHPLRYGRFARALNDRGLIVWSHHHRGHGTNLPDGVKGHFADSGGWRALIDDAWAVSNALLESRPDLPLVLFAHSMGSFVAQGVLARHGSRYRGVVLSGTNGPPSLSEGLARALSPLQIAVLGGRTPGTWLQRLIIEQTYDKPFRPPQNAWLTRDAAEVAAYNSDPLCNFPLTSQAWHDLLHGRASQGSVSFFRQYPRDLPIHVVYGTADSVGEHGTGVRRLLDALQKAGLTNVTSRAYPDARHELLNEINREDVTRDVVEWIVGVSRRPTP